MTSLTPRINDLSNKKETRINFWKSQVHARGPKVHLEKESLNWMLVAEWHVLFGHAPLSRGKQSPLIQGSGNLDFIHPWFSRLAGCRAETTHTT